ncbi:hypothetical protein J1N35_003842 [Gossypium stocksii]|uniref:HAT C-terminal dimerisation domain-containing protein n=1 Tax=Gossypium stocksii TaxID=47602 RepID=A0A9D3WBN6_9ROSI|nr:hypothetical protein J1N35_003842 [Gossypium stocksii]
MKIQLEYFELDAHKSLELKKVLMTVKLYQVSAKIQKLEIYLLVARIVRLVLILLVSIVMTEQAFLTIKIVKTRLLNKMEDNFLSYLVAYMKKDID